MTAEINPDIIKSTQEILGKFVKKPSLTEKLLNKPPFRFLHDIVNAVVKEHKLLKGLYTADELNSQNIKDRDGKIEFLQKLVDVLSISTNQKLSVKPSKIVAGHEADKTNEMLQALGNIIANNIDCTDAIKTVLSGSMKKEKSKSKDKKNNEEKQINDKKIDKNSKSIQSEPVRANRSTKVDASNQNKATKTKARSDRTEKPGSRSTSDEKRKSEEKKKSLTNREKLSKRVNSKDSDNKIKKEISVESSKSNEEEDKVSLQSDKIEKIEKISTIIEVDNAGLLVNKNQNLPNLDNESSDKALINQKISQIDSETKNSKKNDESDGKPKALSPIEKMDSLKESSSATVKEQSSLEPKPNQILKENINQQNDNDNNAKIKPTELKRQTTFIREESKENISRPRTSLRPPSVRPPSARPGAPRRRDKNVEIILQPNDSIKTGGIQVKVNSFNADLEDDGENLVIIENNTNQVDNLLNVEKEENTAEVIAEDLQQGHLVQQILETQKELATDLNDKTEDMDISRLQQRQNSAKQMNSLRDIIQNLTKSINPLGKLMDFIPEDVDSMQLELTMWRDIYSQASIELKREKSLTETAVEPMKNQLVQINDSIKEYQEMIDNIRARILQNSDKIFILLTD